MTMDKYLEIRVNVGDEVTVDASELQEFIIKFNKLKNAFNEEVVRVKDNNRLTNELDLLNGKLTLLSGANSKLENEVKDLKQKLDLSSSLRESLKDRIATFKLSMPMKIDLVV